MTVDDAYASSLSLPACVPFHFLSAYRKRIMDGILHAFAPDLASASRAPAAAPTYLPVYLLYLPPYQRM